MSDARRDFFVSYTRADRAWAEWIAWQLEENGYSVVIQAWDFGAGSNFVHEMQQAAAKAERTIAVLSPDYLTSQFTQPEWYAAFAQDPTGEKRLLVPVRVRECALEGLLPQIVYVDLVGLEPAAATAALLAAAQGSRGKPSNPPAFPGSPSRTVSHEPRFPGTLPPVWTIPHLRNPNFTGRDDLLDELEAALESGQSVAVTQAITGQGGVGKTQLAVEYAYRRVDRYDAVLWLEAEQTAALPGQYAQLATELKLGVPAGGDQSEAIRAVRTWLERERRWLLVFDNAAQPQDLREYLPRAGAGHVLVTSRNPHWSSVARPLSVPLLPVEDAIEYLARRTGSDDHESARELAEELDRLPLTLSQAAGYIETTRIAPDDYLHLFRTRRRDLWQQEQAPDDYQRTVAVSLSLSLEKLSEPAGDLLRLCAFLAPDAIPRSLLVAFSGDVLKLNPALQELGSYSLLELTPDSVSMHRLLQAVVRDELSEVQQRSWAERAVKLIRAAFPYEEADPQTWSPCALLLPHALAAVEHGERSEAAPETCGALLNEAAAYLRMQGRYSEARALYQRALAVLEQAYSADHPTLAALCSNLALVEQDLGNLAEARSLLQRAIAISERANAADHPVFASSYSNLAMVERDLGNPAEARSLMKKAIALEEKAYAADDPTLAVDYSNLALVEQDLGNLAEARRLLQRAIAIDEKAYAADHPALAVRYSNLATVEQDLGNLAEARTLQQRAIAISEKAYAADHPMAGVSYNNLARIEHELGNAAEAMALMRRAHAIVLQKFGAEHPRTRASASWLAKNDPEWKS